MPPSIADYLSRRRLSGPWSLEGTPEHGFRGAVIIPSLAENTLLFHTLASLAANEAEALRSFIIVVVVNNRADALPEEKADNLATLATLSQWAASTPLRLTWVDGASLGRELPDGGGGVGMARKIGFDLALSRLNFSLDPILVALDADTLVQPDYLTALVDHFRTARSGGASIPFRHQSGGTPAEEEAILLYELFLRSYVLGLSLAGSPYGFHTVGSAMACTAAAYVRMGGMNTRLAAEDFYFLQQLQRTCGVDQVKGTCVYPSARASHRVPFGTGRAVSRYLRREKDAISFYDPVCYRLLSDWLHLVTNGLEKSAEELLSAAADISPDLAGFLTGSGFSETWPRLQRHNRTPHTLVNAFHGWFDGLKTMKLIHHLSAAGYPRGPADLFIPGLLQVAKIPEPTATPAAWLDLMRILQGASDRENLFFAQH